MNPKDETATIETDIQETLELLCGAVTRNGMLLTADARVSEPDAAALLGMAHETLAKRRAMSKAPPSYRLPVGTGRVSYRLGGPVAAEPKMQFSRSKEIRHLQREPHDAPSLIANVHHAPFE